jgi:hypothetical protein
MEGKRNPFLKTLDKELKNKGNDELQAILMDGAIGQHFKEAVKIEFIVREIKVMHKQTDALYDLDRRLETTNERIEKLDKSSTRLGWIMIVLTGAILILTLAMFLK